MKDETNDPGGLTASGHKDAEKSMDEFQRVIQSYVDAVNSDQPEAANQAALTVLIMAAAEAEARPTPSLLLGQKTSEMMAAHDWVGAERGLRELLLLEEQTGNPGLVTKPQIDLCGLYRLFGRLDDAWQLACAATANARRTEIGPLIAMALDSQARCALHRGDRESALAAAAQGLKAVDPGKMGDLMRARALVTLARCQVAAGQPAEAETSLQASWRLLSGSSHASFGLGPVAALAAWHGAQAELHASRNSWGKAAAALSQAIEHRREGLHRSCEANPHAWAGMAEDLEKLAEASAQLGDAPGAGQARAEARRIWEELRLPKKP